MSGCNVLLLAHLCAVLDTADDLEAVCHDQSPNRRAHSWVVFSQKTLSDLQ